MNTRGQSWSERAMRAVTWLAGALPTNSTVAIDLAAARARLESEQVAVEPPPGETRE